MRIEGTHTFEADRDTVWEALQDPDVLMRTMPGCEELEQVGEHQYRGMMKLRIGTMQGAFSGLITLSDFDAPQAYRLKLDGTGALGFVRGEGGVRLEAQDGRTLMHYAGDAQVGGRIASVGQRLLDRTARALTQQSLEGLSQQIAAREAGVGDGQAAAVEAPSQTEFALGVARNILADVTPPADEQMQWLKTGLAALGALLLAKLAADWWIERLARRVAALVNGRDREGERKKDR